MDNSGDEVLLTFGLKKKKPSDGENEDFLLTNYKPVANIPPLSLFQSHVKIFNKYLTYACWTYYKQKNPCR